MSGNILEIGVSMCTNMDYTHMCCRNTPDCVHASAVAYLWTSRRKQTLVLWQVFVCVLHSLEVCGDFLVPVVIIISLSGCVCALFDRAFCKQGRLCLCAVQRRVTEARCTSALMNCDRPCHLLFLLPSPLLSSRPLTPDTSPPPSSLVTTLIVLRLTDRWTNGVWLQQKHRTQISSLALLLSLSFWFHSSPVLLLWHIFRCELFWAWELESAFSSLSSSPLFSSPPNFFFSVFFFFSLMCSRTSPA